MEKEALYNLVKNRNIKILCVNHMAENLRPISADKTDIIRECQRQLYEIITYRIISLEGAKSLVSKVKFELKIIVCKHLEKVSCSHN